MLQSNKVCGFYKMEAIKVKDGKEVSKRVVADWFPNLITNGGLDRMATVSDILTYCSVGSGNTAPAFTDATLESKVAHLAIASMAGGLTSGFQTTSPYYNWFKGTYRFPEGLAAGNLSEVGIGWSTTLLFSRALILDLDGDPTTITILSDEILDVYYEYRVYPKEDDVTGSVTFTGNLGGTYDWTFRIANADDAAPYALSGYSFPIQMNYASYPGSFASGVFTGGMASILSTPSGTKLATGVITYGPYTNGTYSITGTIPLSVTQGNFTPAGVKTFHFAVGTRRYQIEFDPAIPKTNYDALSITFTIEWGRL